MLFSLFTVYFSYYNSHQFCLYSSLRLFYISNYYWGSVIFWVLFQEVQNPSICIISICMLFFLRFYFAVRVSDLPWKAFWNPLRLYFFSELGFKLISVGGFLLPASEVGRSEGPPCGWPGRFQQDVCGHEEDWSGRHGEAGPVPGRLWRPAFGKHRLWGNRKFFRWSRGWDVWIWQFLLLKIVLIMLSCWIKLYFWSNVFKVQVFIKKTKKIHI